LNYFLRVCGKHQRPEAGFTPEENPKAQSKNAMQAPGCLIALTDKRTVRREFSFKFS